jgi:hypothetical protein
MEILSLSFSFLSDQLLCVVQMGILYQLKKRTGLNKLAIFWVCRFWENQIEPIFLEMFKE